jgi:hypothetical protein
MAVPILQVRKIVPMRYRGVLLLPIVLGACQEAGTLQKQPFEIASASDLSDEFRACVTREATAVVQRVSSRGQVALIARHEEMNRDVAAACNSRSRNPQPDETSYIAREIDKEIEAWRARRSVGSIR